jgi:PAS domain S-box-containing protein
MRVLFVEDTPQDMALVLRTLKKEGLEIESQRVASIPDMKSALSQPWDIILSDYNLPGFTAIEVLKTIADLKVLTPVIVISSAVTDEAAAAAMRSGASDFVRKENTSRLAPAILREIQTAKEKNQQKKQLEDSERQFRTLADTIPQLAWMTDGQGFIFWYNRNWYDYTGTTLEQMRGWGWKDVHHPDHVEKVTKRWSSHLESGDDWEDTFPLKNKQGEWRWFLSRARPTKDETGKIAYWFGTNTDITDELMLRESVVEQKKQLEVKARELASERHKLENIFQKAPAGMALWTGEDLNFEKSNSKFEQLFGKQPIIGKPLLEALPELRGQGFDVLLKKVMEDGDAVEATEMPARVPTGVSGETEERYFDISYIPVPDADGKPYGVFDHAVDVTDRVKSRKTLEAAKLEAERANKLKSAFLANMSHEIRTPLGVMLGFADMICDPDISGAERTQFARTLRTNGEQLSILINDILDLSKVEAGHMTVESLQFSLRRLIEEVLSALNVKAAEKGIRLSYKHDASCPDLISSDPTRLRQILWNLVGNAIKFTSKGEVLISIGCEDSFLCFEVTDTGVGIAPEHVPSLFKTFSQGDESMTRKFGGTGLGLALSKGLAEALGGELMLKSSKLGAGSTFSLKVRNNLHSGPVAAAKKEGVQIDANRDAVNKLDGISILIVDDSLDNQTFISRMLMKKGAVVEIASDGQEGFDKALKGSFNLILMDLQMPVMDGYTATQKLRELGYRTPIVALTAHAMSEVRKKCLDVGYNDHLPKPVNSDDLVRMIQKYTANQNRAAAEV